MAAPALAFRATRSALSLVRPAALLSRPLPLKAPTTPLSISSFHSSSAQLKKGGKADKGKGNKKAAAIEREFEEDEVSWEGSGKKGKGKGKLVSGHGREMEESVGNKQVSTYELAEPERGMDDAVERMRVGFKAVVGRVGRVSPDLLDKVRVDEGDGHKRPLNEFASVSVKDGKDLLVTVYQESYLKAVSAAIFASPLSLAPQAIGATTLRVPIPRADWDKRQQLVKQASDLAEQARIAVRLVRTKAQKEIKAELEKGDGVQEAKKLDAATKKRTDEVDKIFEQAKKVLMDE